MAADLVSERAEELRVDASFSDRAGPREYNLVVTSPFSSRTKRAEWNWR
jgi:hypothetical protein